MVVPAHVPLPIVPTVVREDVTTFAAKVNPVNVPAGATLAVSALPTRAPVNVVATKSPVEGWYVSFVDETLSGTNPPVPVANKG
jgi:hypothetical protein